MNAFFTQLFRPVADSEAATRKHLLWWMLLRLLLMSVLCITAALLRDRSNNLIIPPLPQTSFFLLALCLFSIGSAFLLQKANFKGRKLKAFVLAQLWADALFVAFFVYATGCSFSNFTPLFILPIITAGLILYKPGSLILATGSTFLYAAVLLVELYGPLPEYFQATNYRRPVQLLMLLTPFAFYGLLFFLSALLSGQMGSRLHRTQQALRKTTQAYGQLAHLYRQIFNDIGTGIITTDPAGRINSYNQAAASITGCKRALVLGEPLARHFSAIADQLPNNPGRSVCDFVKPDGEAIRLGYSCAPLRLVESEDRDAGLAKVITLQDISRVERMERQMREAEKLAAIGEMSAMIAHDFRNPLAAISGSAQMLSMSADSSQAGATRVTATLAAIILRETGRMEKTIADFLLFARPQPPRQQWFQLRPVLEDQIARFLGTGERFSNLTLQWDIPVDMLCWADQGQIGVIVRQAVENAWLEVQENQAIILIRASVQELPGEHNSLSLEVCDQGPGIPAELREKVFAPFFSHRAKGTGLGLAIVRQIAQQHGGTALIDESEDYRCIVRITMPQPKIAPR